MKINFTTNTLLFIFNVNLFALQFVVYVSLSGSKQNLLDQVGPTERRADDDDVIVYNNHIKDIAEPDEPKQGSLGIVPQDQLPGKLTACNTTWNWNWDRRAGTRSQANRFIYLVRHGQYYANGPYEKHLSPLGQQQAVKVGQKLKDYNITFHRFITSTSIRAAETADGIHRLFPHLSLEYSDELKEGWPAFPEPPSPGVWDKNNPIFQRDVPRLDKAYKKYIYRANTDITSDSNEMIVAHGNVIAYFVLRSLQVPSSRWLKVAVLQASITLLQVHPDGDVTLRLLGDIGHLPRAEWSG